MSGQAALVYRNARPTTLVFLARARKATQLDRESVSTKTNLRKPLARAGHRRFIKPV